jgi:hypothetical protein
VVEHRGESDLERADRNWDELLGELRVTQTGVAVLFSLLLTVPFSSRFEDVTSFQRQVYLAALLLSAASAIVLIAPVAYHRLLFRQRQKPHVVQVANRMALAGLGLLGLTLVAVLLLVTDVLLARPIAVTIAAVFAAGTTGLWVLPGALRRNGV